jgi:hypothetical protein
MDQFIERKIITGLITSTEYIKQIRDIYQARLLTAGVAKRIATWCIEYYDKYQQAPGRNIETIFFQKLKSGLPKDLAEEIEQEILPGLSEEYTQSQEDLTYLIDETRLYFTKNYLDSHINKIQALQDTGQFAEAQAIATSFKPLAITIPDVFDFGAEESVAIVRNAFVEFHDPLIILPKVLGKFMNMQFTRGSFLALMSTEKRGKTYWLMEFARRAVQQDLSVAFFQAGDMTRNQQIRRFCINLAKTSDLECYCGEQFQPISDCIYNQLNICQKHERTCNFGIFSSSRFTEKDLRDIVTIEHLKAAWKDNPDYVPCSDCKDFRNNRWGTPWIEKINVKGPLMPDQGAELFRSYYVQRKIKMLLSTHSNGSLSVNNIKAILNSWERAFSFFADIIIIDYADLLIANSPAEFRHQQNEIWRNLRSLAQETRGSALPMVITATQADAAAYENGLLRLRNFSEDKRKYGHVTAMYGLNQDPHDREKKIGLMRINELIIREADFSNDNTVTILQNLRRGLPYISSYL